MSSSDAFKVKVTDNDLFPKSSEDVKDVIVGGRFGGKTTTVFAASVMTPSVSVILTLGVYVPSE